MGDHQRRGPDFVVHNDDGTTISSVALTEAEFATLEAALARLRSGE